MVWNIDLGMQYRNDELSNGETAGPDPHVHLLETGIVHRGGEILERCAVTDTVDDDIFVEVECAGRVLNEETNLAVSRVDGEQKSPIAAAIRIVFADSRAKATGRGIQNGRLVEFASKVLNRIRRIPAVVEADDAHRDAIPQDNFFPSADAATLRCRDALCKRLETRRHATDHWGAGQLRPRWSVPCVIKVAVAGEEIIKLRVTQHGIAHAGDRCKIDTVRLPRVRVQVIGIGRRRDEKRWPRNSCDMRIHDDARVANVKVPIGDRHPCHLDARGRSYRADGRNARYDQYGQPNDGICHDYSSLAQFYLPDSGARSTALATRLEV